MKFCKDCKYFVRLGMIVDHSCAHIGLINNDRDILDDGEINLVTGVKPIREKVSCTFIRQTEKLCGKEARSFEAKK